MGSYKIKGNMIKLYFDHEPNNLTKKLLIRFGWKWSSYQQCWINKNIDSNINIAKNSLSNEDIIQLNYDTSLYIYDKKEHFNHNVNSVSVKINICDTNAILQTEISTVFFCKDCDKYYIMPQTLKDVRERGIPLVKIIENHYQGLKEESELHLMGYNVSQKEGPTQKQRRFILNYIYENKYMSKERIMSCIRWYLSNNNTWGEIARSKWKDDLEYLENVDLVQTGYIVRDIEKNSFVAWNGDYNLNDRDRTVIFNPNKLSLFTINFPERIYDIIEIKYKCYNKEHNEIKIIHCDEYIDTHRIKIMNEADGDFDKYPLPWWWY